ncbi:hypothetical protein GWK47_024886 [Chionoecetes opilio]|uniref:Uncharacterized protein n=1 Tax=Chionoecetes opilio TaxID=41210 RepID=A0A8J4XV28_CHIOP|nr:hypothetical protein GWK47_024886 [Chionoecetes opilio]
MDGPGPISAYRAEKMEHYSSVTGLPPPKARLAMHEVQGKPVKLRQAPGAATTKGVVLSYPVAMSLKPLRRHPRIVVLERWRSRQGDLTRQVVITIEGVLVGAVDLGSRGIYSRPVSKEPLRCHCCQQYDQRLIYR